MSNAPKLQTPWFWHLDPQSAVPIEDHLAYPLLYQTTVWYK